MDLKRKSDSTALVEMAPPKQPRQNELVAVDPETKKQLMAAGIERTSSLMAPIMLLTGHEGDIFCCEFSNDGQFIASSGFDRLIKLWNVYGECENWIDMKGHSGAVMEIQFSTDDNFLYSCSTDKTVSKWDLEVCERVKKFKGHQAYVNSVNCARRGPQLLCSGSDDGTVKVWDTRQRQAVHTFQATYQVTAVSFSDTAEQVFSGGIDNDIKVWDLRKSAMAYKMKGHTDTVTGMELSPDGSYLLTNSMDHSLRCWDVRPFAPQERCVKTFGGHKHSFEMNLLRCSWSPDGSKVAAGSGDRHVYVWDTTSRRILYKLPGHEGSVNDVDFHPTEPIIMSASSDKQIYLGEIE